MNTQSDIEPGSESTPERKHFTLAEANSALPYVTRVTGDIRDTYRKAIEIQERLEQDPEAAEQEALQASYEREVERLKDYVDELQEVGVELKDYEAGLVDFPALHEGREIYLCWKAGEKRIEAWHETSAGFAGRQDVACLSE